MATHRHAAIQSEIAEKGYADGDQDHVETFVEMKVKQEIEIRKRSYLETLGWLVAGAIVLWYGDGNRDFVTAVLHNPRLHQQPFFVACICVVVNTTIFLYLGVWVRHIRQDERNFSVVAPGAIPTATILGLSSYCLFVYSMWPIWGWVIIPMLYIFFMDFVVLSPYLPPYIKKKQ